MRKAMLEFGRALEGAQVGLFCWSKSGAGGLASMDAPQGTLIAYATAPGKTAADGEGRNGTYTGALLSELRVPGLKVEDVFKRARNRLKALKAAAAPPRPTPAEVASGGRPVGVPGGTTPQDMVEVPGGEFFMGCNRKHLAGMR
jgi:uncharacterized caspase-like protein